MIEVVISLMLIVLFLSGITIVQLTASKNMSYSQNKSIATRLARQQLERARVMRDISGINALDMCQTNCYIDYKLNLKTVIPTGVFVQKLNINPSAEIECPLPNITITPVPVSYQAKATVSWDTNVNVTPPPLVEMTSCITDWR